MKKPYWKRTKVISQSIELYFIQEVFIMVNYKKYNIWLFARSLTLVVNIMC